MDEYVNTKVRLAVREEMMKDEDWSNPRILDEVKQKFQECASGDIDALYLEELRAKVELMSETELRTLLHDQCARPPSSRNCPLLTLVQAKLA